MVPGLVCRHHVQEKQTAQVGVIAKDSANVGEPSLVSPQDTLLRAQRLTDLLSLCTGTKWMAAWKQKGRDMKASASAVPSPLETV